MSNTNASRPESFVVDGAALDRQLAEITNTRINYVALAHDKRELPGREWFVPPDVLDAARSFGPLLTGGITFLVWRWTAKPAGLVVATPWLSHDILAESLFDAMGYLAEEGEEALAAAIDEGSRPVERQRRPRSEDWPWG